MLLPLTKSMYRFLMTTPSQHSILFFPPPPHPTQPMPIFVLLLFFYDCEVCVCITEVQLHISVYLGFMLTKSNLKRS